MTLIFAFVTLIFATWGASLFCIIKMVYLGVLKKGGGGGYPQALLEGLTSEARY